MSSSSHGTQRSLEQSASGSGHGIPEFASGNPGARELLATAAPYNGPGQSLSADPVADDTADSGAADGAERTAAG